jgi:hypothetical protein
VLSARDCTRSGLRARAQLKAGQGGLSMSLYLIQEINLIQVSSLFRGMRMPAPGAALLMMFDDVEFARNKGVQVLFL